MIFQSLSDQKKTFESVIQPTDLKDLKTLFSFYRSLTSLAFLFIPCMTVEFIVLLIDEVNKVDDYIYFRIIKHCSGMECYL